MSDKEPIPPLQRPAPHQRPPGYRQPGPTTDIDDVILELERLAGLRSLPQSAREIILDFVDSKVRQAMEKVAEQVGKYAANYEVEPPLFDPPKRQTRRKRGWSNAQQADYWRSLEQAIRSQIPRDPAQPGARR